MEFREEFEILENDAEENAAESKNSQVRCWVGTWNNPKQSDEEFKRFFEELLIAGSLQYAVFQREKGEESGIIHFQFFINFKNAKRFVWLKSHLPYGCHFKPMRTTKTLCKNYCSKEDTRVSGPYEIGEFVEERQRTDKMKAYQMLTSGVSLKEIGETFENVVIDNYDKMKRYQLQQLKWQMEGLSRNIEVVYIYGNPGFGKTTLVYELAGCDPSKICVVSNYKDKFMFTDYVGQKLILFDEFAGQIKPITYVNKLLEHWPINLRVLGNTFPACYEKVFIVSNYSLNEIYKEEQENMKVSYDAFLRRINTVYHFTALGKYHLEKETIWEEIPVDKQKFKGYTRQPKEVYSYTPQGVRKKIWDRYNAIQMELNELTIDNTEIPFD